MKILYVLNSGQPGGMEQHVVNLVEGMLLKGHEIHVWSPSGPTTERIKALGAKHTEKVIKLDIDPIYIFELVKYLKQNKIEIIHAHEIKAVTNAVLAGWFARTKVRIAHTHTPISEWQVHPFLKFINLLGYPWLVNLFSTCEIALTPSRLRIKQKEGIWHKKLKVVVPGNCVKSEEFINSFETRRVSRLQMCEKYGLESSKFLIMQIGRVSEEKGHSVMLSAYTSLCKDKKFAQDTQLIFAGGGPLEDEVRKKAADKNLNIKITGRFADEDRAKLFATPDLFVHPSLAEGWGIVAVESMLSKNVTLLSDLEVLREVCGEYPCYFKTSDASSLEARIRDIYENYAEYKRNLDDAVTFVSTNYSFEKFILAYESFYQQHLV